MCEKRLLFVCSFLLFLLLSIPILILWLELKLFMSHASLQKQGYVVSDMSEQRNQPFIEQNIQNIWHFFDKIDAKEEAELSIIERDGLQRIIHTVHYQHEKFQYTKTYFQNGWIETEIESCLGIAKTPYYIKVQEELYFSLYCGKGPYDARIITPDSHTMHFDLSKGFIVDVYDKRYLLKEENISNN